MLLFTCLPVVVGRRKGSVKHTPLLLLAQFCLCKLCGFIDYSKQTKHSSSTSNQQQPQECTYKCTCMYVCGNVAIMKRRERESQPNLKFDSSMHVLCFTRSVCPFLFSLLPQCNARLARSGQISLISPRTAADPSRLSFRKLPAFF